MRKPPVLVVLTLALFLALSVTPGEASSPPLAVTFEVQTTLSHPNGGPFVATGPAVDAGIICSHGSTVDVDLKASGEESPTTVNYQVHKKFTCAEPQTNTFVVKMQVRKGNNYSWNIVEGTGNYERLRGTGQGQGTFVSGQSYDVLDVFRGAVHVD